jgi:hypothetical protein
LRHNRSSRQCALASVTSFVYVGDALEAITYDGRVDATLGGTGGRAA